MCGSAHMCDWWRCGCRCGDSTHMSAHSVYAVLVMRTSRVLMVSAHLNTYKLRCSHKANLFDEHSTKTL